MLLLPLVIALQQSVAPTTPPSGDTVGYWQQDASYTIVARLDEQAQAARATGELAYTNHSPDTLRELYVYQYLNAFRPGSRWSAADEREGRVRFQHLAEPNFAYERFTDVPTVDGTPVAPTYPYAPDSTIARFVLPRPLAPGGVITVHFAWEARPSRTVYRRQGRLGRHYDFAQWYPKVAVYDRRGWALNPLVPAGELYGEFGTFDVTIVAANDQVLGATGVPVEGDPGWRRVLKWGTVNIPRNAFGALPPAPVVTLADGERAVRFYSRGTHHFAWTASPDYVYEGGVYRASLPVGALYEPRGAKGWGNGVAVEWQKFALQWLESIYGRYAYPMLLGTQRLDGGATEFPMMVMYGSAAPSQSLVLHETGHIYSYGILANNEWASGWMDEGLTSYQTSWALNETPQERAKGLGPREPHPPAGYRAHATRPANWQQGEIDQFALVLTGRAEPIGTPGPQFNEFSIYNDMVYDRAEMMYGALRAELGDSLFRAFLKDYYARWQFKHVDELAMRASAERVSRSKLDWFFEQWVHRTGLVDYSISNIRFDTSRPGSHEETAQVSQRGSYQAALKIGFDTHGDNSVVVQIHDPRYPIQLEGRTDARPLPPFRLDPDHLTTDWDSRNDNEPNPTKIVFGWPFLDQWDRYRNVAAISPQLWYTGPGGLTIGARLRSNYQKLVDEWDVGLAMAVRSPTASKLPQLQGWIAVNNPRAPWRDLPYMGLRTGLWMVDGTFRFTLQNKWDESPFHFANGRTDTLTIAFNVTSPYDRAWQDTARWSDATVADVSGEWKWRSRRPALWFARFFMDGGLAVPRAGAPGYGGFGRAEIEGGGTLPLAGEGRLSLMLRAFGGVSSSTPPQRSMGLSSLDPTTTFDNNFLRGSDAILVLPDVPYVPLGGAGMRGYSLYTTMRNVGSVNTQLAFTLNTPKPRTLMPRIQAAIFGDLAYGSTTGSAFTQGEWYDDAGVSAILRGALYDKPYALRIDLPIWMNRPTLAPGNQSGTETVAFRWTFTVGDLW